MKRLSYILIAAAVSVMLTGCGLYKKYEKTVEEPANAFGTSQAVQAAQGDESLAQMSWREFFQDPMLQQLIEQVLLNNTDMHAARIAVEQSEAALKAAKLAYLPSLFVSPQGTLSKFDDFPWSKAYDLPLQISVDIDAFGSITSKKRAAKAVALQAQVVEDATRANIISTTAQQYYMLQLLDQQLQILTMTDSLWKASLETQRSLWENGKAYSTAVNQLEASYLDVKTQIVDTRRSIRATENAICRLLGVTPQHIERTRWTSKALDHPDAQENVGPHIFNARYLKLGIPATMLEQRPDIRLANYAMEEAFYNTQTARAAFFPSITLSGLVGWTNAGSGIVVNPGKLLLNFVGQLTQPIFARGKLRANYKISKLAQEELQKKYVQTVIDAGNQVNEAMADFEAAQEKYGFYDRQVRVLYDAYKGTHELMDNGKAIYLEVLTAQESLLRAQLSEAANIYNGAQSVVALYIALGGGSKE